MHVLTLLQIINSVDTLSYIYHMMIAVTSDKYFETLIVFSL